MTLEELVAVVRRAQAGDAEAQSTLVRAYWRRVGGLVRTVVRQSSAVEDLVQMSFIKMVRSLPWLRDPQVFESWLFRLARSIALDHIRRQRCRPVTVAAEHEFLNAPDVRGDSSVHEISEALERALQRLGEKDQTLMRMIVQGHDYRTIASRAGLTVGAVKARVSRVRTFLRVAVGCDTGTRQPKPHELALRPGCRLQPRFWRPAPVS